MNVNDMVNDFGEALEPKNIRLSKSHKSTQEWFESNFILPELDIKTIPITSKFVQTINMLICDLQQLSYDNMFVTLTFDKLTYFFEYIYTIPDYILPKTVIYGFIQNHIDRHVDLFFIKPTPDTRFGYNPTYFNPKYKDLVYETNRVIDRELRCKSIETIISDGILCDGRFINNPHINLNNFTIKVDSETMYKYGET